MYFCLWNKNFTNCGPNIELTKIHQNFVKKQSLCTKYRIDKNKPKFVKKNSHCISASLKSDSTPFRNNMEYSRSFNAHGSVWLNNNHKILCFTHLGAQQDHCTFFRTCYSTLCVCHCFPVITLFKLINYVQPLSR